MTQPPYGADSGQSPWQPQGQSQWQPQGQYPRQNLLPQEVRPGRSRTPLILTAVAVVVVLAVVLIGLRILHNRGEDTRAEYCAALKQVTQGDLVQALGGELGNGPAAFSKVRRLAPASVKSQWDELVSIASSIPTSEPDLGLAAALLTDLKVIIDDANTNCGMNLKIPFS